MKNKIKQELYEFRLLMRNIPPIVLSLFVITIITMNLLANKSLNISLAWLALDCGTIISWLAFLINDILTKHFGPKAATEVSILASIINLFVCLIFFIGSRISGVWGESFIEGSENIINNALDNTFGGTWYVVMGSTIAFLLSAFVNNFLNYLVGKLFKKHPDGFLAYASRTYISTAIGQFVDNITFTLIVSHFFFGWTMLQCFMSALMCMLFELILEVIFSPIGYKVSGKWKKDNVGNEYLDYIKRRAK